MTTFEKTYYYNNKWQLADGTTSFTPCTKKVTLRYTSQGRPKKINEINKPYIYHYKEIAFWDEIDDMFSILKEKYGITTANYSNGTQGKREAILKWIKNSPIESLHELKWQPTNN